MYIIYIVIALINIHIIGCSKHIPISKVAYASSTRSNSDSTLTETIRIKTYYDPETISPANHLTNDQIDYIHKITTTAVTFYESFTKVIPVSTPLYYWSCNEWDISSLITKCYSYHSKCGQITIPRDHIHPDLGLLYQSPTDTNPTQIFSSGHGIAESDVIIYVSYDDTTIECENGELAHSAYCVQDQYGRPYAGNINLCSSMIPSSSKTDEVMLEQNVVTIENEMANILIMDKNLWSDFGSFYDISDVLDTTNPMNDGLQYIITPKVGEITRAHFNCPSLPGAPLQKSSNHWDERLLSSSQDIAGSILTFALMEDSGWYYVDYKFALSIQKGVDAGCGWFDGAQSRRVLVGDCVEYTDCLGSEVCRDSVCVDACGAHNPPCVANSECYSTHHMGQCRCLEGYTGDGFIECSIDLTTDFPTIQPTKDPTLSPTSFESATASPTTCVFEEQCLDTETCTIDSECVDLCNYDNLQCGINAECYVDHTATPRLTFCRCLEGYSGDPDVQCDPMPTSSPTTEPTTEPTTADSPCGDSKYVATTMTFTTWAGARQNCQDNGMILATFDTAEDIQQIYDICAVQQHAICWGGFNDEDNDGVYKFIDNGEIVDEARNYWYGSDPTGAGNVAESCGVFVGQISVEHSVADWTCTEPLGLNGICECVEDSTASPSTSEPTTATPTTADPTTSDPTTAAPTTASPTTSEPTTADSPFGDSKYVATTMATPTWSEAEQNCQDNGMILATFDTAEELEQIYDVCKATGALCWLGFYDEDNDGIYKFIDNDQIVPDDYWYTEAEPSGSGNAAEVCGAIITLQTFDSSLSDALCNVYTTFGVCECIPSESPTTAFPTTSEPTTSEPTTATPTTSSPTTAVPTTASPTTSAPSTSNPTTASPTTDSPTTATPTTTNPTTAAPTMHDPTIINDLFTDTPPVASSSPGWSSPTDELVITGDYHGPYTKANIGEKIIIEREFQCASRSEVHVSFYAGFCRGDKGDYVKLYLNDERKVTIKGNVDGTKIDNPELEAASGCTRDFEWIQTGPYDIDKVEAGEIFEVQFEIKVTGSNDAVSIYGMEIECDVITTSGSDDSHD